MGNYREKYFEEMKSDHGWYTCRKCGGKFRKKDMDVDHILPQHYRGPDHIINLQGLCKHCNRSKQDSLKETLPDLVGANVDRVKQKVDTKVEQKKKEVQKKIDRQKAAVVEKVSNTFLGKLLVTKKK